MQPNLEFLSVELISRILDEAYQLMMNPGIKVLSTPARVLLADAGAHIGSNSDVVKIPQKVVQKALDTVPKIFFLFNRLCECKVTYGGRKVHFDPGSSVVHIKDHITLEHKLAYTCDLIRLVKVVEILPQYDAQSTAFVCDDVPKEIGDLYRLYLVLVHSLKPVVTGAFSIKTLDAMIDLVALVAGGRTALAEMLQVVFDVCPSPPLIWSKFGADNLIALACARIPAEIVSMPLAGAVSLVTLLGSVTQHAAECLSGITIHQLAKPGSPIVWGAAPAIFNMRKGITQTGAVETAMIDAAYAQVGKYLEIPTHCHLGASDSKVIDAQAGLESGVTAVIGVLSGINMTSGADMLDFLACQSAEKLVVDAEAIAMAQGLLTGIEIHTETLATGFFNNMDFKGDFLKQKATRELFRTEQCLPSAIIDRNSVRGWQEDGSLDTFERAKLITTQLLKDYQRPQIALEKKMELTHMVKELAIEAGMSELPIMA